MGFIYPCECNPSYFPMLEPIEAPIPFQSIHDFETWLREEHIPRTLTERRVHLPTPYKEFNEIDVNKVECWGIFSSDRNFKRCCQVYPETHLVMYPEFENLLRGKIFSHNHFSLDSTLSVYDVFQGINLQMKEIRAVTENCTYIIRPLNQNWPNPDLLLKEIKTIFPLFDFDPSIINDNELRHICYQILDRERWFEYRQVDTTHD